MAKVVGATTLRIKRIKKTKGERTKPKNLKRKPYRGQGRV